MIISFQHRFIFVAIPKTATHAVRGALRPHLARTDWEQCVLFEERFFPVEPLAQIGHGHISCREIRPFLLPAMWESLLKFCCVRNPYDRFVSYCYFINREKSLIHGNPLDMMKGVIGDKKSAREILFRPQSDFVTDDDGQLAVDVVCRFENLQEDFTAVFRRLGFPETQLEHVNVTNLAPRSGLFDLELKEMVNDFYRRDFEVFGYPAELEESKLCR